MAIIAKADGEKNFTPIPEGVHVSVCYGIVDIGIQYSEKFDKKAHKVMLLWEFPDETIDTDEGKKPRVLSKEYTLSLGEKSTLRKDLQAWRGKVFTEEELAGFDLKNILGVGCQMQIIHTEKNGNSYASMAALMALPKSMKVENTFNPKVYFDLSEPDAVNKMGILPQWIQDKIKVSETYKEIIDSQGPMAVDSDDDLPF